MKVSLPVYSGLVIFLFSLVLACVAFLHDQKSTRERSLKKQQKQFTIFFIAVVCVAASVRLFVLPIGILHVDAFYHLQAAQQMLHGVFPDYTRGLLYTAMIAGAQAIFGQSTVVAMLLNVTINISTLVLLILVTRKYFSDSVAVVVSLLYAFSPWSISMSSYIRMYDLFQLLVLFTTFLVFHFLFRTSLQQFEKPFTLRGRFVVQAFMVMFFAAVTFHVHALAAGLILVLIIVTYLRALLSIAAALYEHRISQLLRDPFIVYSILLTIAIGIVMVFFPYLIGQFKASFTWHVNILATLRAPLGYYQFILGQFREPLLFFFAGLSAATAIVYSIRLPQYAYVVVVSLGLCGELLFFERYFSPRYAYHVLPLLLLTVAIGITSFTRMIVQSATANAVKTNSRRLHLLVSVGLVLLVLPYPLITKVFANQIVSKNTINEIFYPYQKAIDTITISPRDYLFSYNTGIWDVMQHTSSHIETVYMQTPEGNLKPKKEVAGNFLSALTHAEHGWFMADPYRQKNWDCNLPEMAPCVVRNFVDEGFTLTKDHIVGDLMLYEWTRHFYQFATPLSAEQFADFTHGKRLMRKVWLDRLTIASINSSGVIQTTHQIRALKKNTQGVFVTIHPVVHLRSHQKIPLKKAVIYVPPYSDQAEQLTYTFDYTPEKIKAGKNKKFTLPDVERITFKYSMLDIATQQLLGPENGFRSFVRSH